MCSRAKIMCLRAASIFRRARSIRLCTRCACVESRNICVSIQKACTNVRQVRVGERWGWCWHEGAMCRHARASRQGARCAGASGGMRRRTGFIRPLLAFSLPSCGGFAWVRKIAKCRLVHTECVGVRRAFDMLLTSVLLWQSVQLTFIILGIEEDGPEMHGHSVWGAQQSPWSVEAFFLTRPGGARLVACGPKRHWCRCVRVQTHHQDESRGSAHSSTWRPPSQRHCCGQGGGASVLHARPRLFTSPPPTRFGDRGSRIVCASRTTNPFAIAVQQPWTALKSLVLSSEALGNSRV